MVKPLFFCTMLIGMLTAKLSGQYTVSTSGTWDPVYFDPIYVPLENNQLSAALPIGFTFPFFGNSYTQFYVSSNGFITFSAGAGSGATPQTIPTAANPNNLIALCWGTIVPEYLDISYETLGSFPNRSLHVNFTVQNFGDGGGCPDGYELYGQIILRENGYNIEIHTEYWNGDQCGIATTQGIENINGTIAFASPDRNNQLWNAYEHYVAFIPNQVTDVAVTTYEPSLCTGSQNIDVIIQNLSNYIIDSVYLDWIWDGVAQDSLFIQGPFPPLDTMLVTLGNKTIVAGEDYTLKAWSYNPDNETDVNHSNDTINNMVYAGLTGIKTVGGTTPDYVTITDAITALETKGVCDSVLFDIRPGTYNENLDIDLFSSSGAGKAIFRSSTGLATDVIITKSYTVSGNNRLVDINQADYVSFRNLTLKVTGTACSNVIYTEGDCEGIEVRDCILRGTSCTTVSSAAATISFVSGDKKYSRIINNDINYGVYGIYFAPGTGKYATDLLIETNDIDSSYRAGMNITRPQNCTIYNNSIFVPQSSAFGIEMGNSIGECRITRNSILATASPYGLRVYGFDDNNGVDTCLIANNMISLAGAISNSKALMVEATEGARIYHNSLHTTSTVNTGMALSVITSTPSYLKNNIISNAGIGKAANLGSVVSNNNVFYNTTQPVITNGSLNYNTLADWQSGTGQDINSLFENPLYISNTNLHTTNILLNGRGVSVNPAIIKDFDEEIRNTTLPDPGADEFGFLTNDMAVADIYFPSTPIEGNNTVNAIVTNLGVNQVDNYSIGWKINAGTPVSLNITTPIPAGGSDTITLGQVPMVAGSNYLIKSYTGSPNNMNDANQANDTLTIGPVYPALNGIYTVYGVAPKFASLNAAFVAISNGGIIDSVELAIRDGFFHEAISPVATAAYSCSKPIKVYSESQDANNVVFDNNNLVQPVIRLNNVHGIKFSKITFQLTSSAFHNVVIVENGASCNSFTACKFTGRISTQTSTAYAVILGNSTQGLNNDYYNNFIQLGSYGLYTNGPNIASGAQVDVIGNASVDNYIGGIALVNVPLARIIGNSVSLTSAKNSNYAGIIANTCKRMEMSHNQVFNPYLGEQGITFSECDGTVQDTTVIFNNYIYSNSSNALASALGGGYSDYTLISNNTSRSTNGRAAGFSWSANFKVENNVFQTMGATPVIELLNMQGSNYSSNHNCLSAPNGSIGEFNNTIYPTLAQWQALGFDVNSFIADPLFDGTTHHVHNALLDSIAIPHSFIQDDFDGDARNTLHPDLGADEFTPVANDAGMSKILSPLVPFPTGINPVYVRFYNNGESTLTSLQLNWSINNVVQTPFMWNGSLNKTVVYDSLEIGTFNFQPYTEYDIKIWSTLPNGLPDGYAANDTVKIDNQFAGMAGIYTIGGDAPDFETITAAVAALQQGGISDDVTFNIRSGIYAQPIALSSIAGAGCERHVVFQSETGNAENVTITNLGVNAHTIVLTGTDGVHFKDLSLTSVNTSFRHVVLFSGGAHCNQFLDNIMTGFVSTATANTSAVIRSTVGLDTANVFSGNIIKEGSYGFNLVGNNTVATNTIVENNVFDTNYRGIYMNNVKDAVIRQNVIIQDESTSSLGVEIYNAPFKEISNNKIQSPNGQYGIYIDNCDNTTTQHGKVYNNFISVGGTSIARGIYLLNTSYQDVYHNSIVVYSTNATPANTTPVYAQSNISLRLFNNALKNAGPGYAVYCSTNSSMAANRNCFLTAGTTFGFWDAGAAETTFALWKTNSGLDAQSLNTDPNFLSNTDLHTYLALLNGAGEPGLGITTDFDGEVRSNPPDIGGDEFDPLPLNDAGISVFAGPLVPFANGTKNIQFVLTNYGGNTLTSVEVHWTVNGIEQAPFNWSGTLPSTQSVTLTLGTYLIAPLLGYQIDAWTTMPNGNADADTDNDLLSVPVFYASLSGTYTVGGFTPSFNLVSELETILTQSGIVGNVTFNFRDGTYTEAIQLNDFPRSSYAYGVTFQSESGDSTDVVLTQNVNNVALIDFDDAHRVTFKKLTLRNTKGHVCHIRNGSSLISIEQSRLEGSEVLSSARSLVYSATTTEDSITVLNNVLQHGYYGVYLYGTAYEKRHIIQGNSFIGNFNYCIYLRKFDSATLTLNQFNATSTSNRDLYMFDGTNASTITRNRIISDNSSQAVLISTITNVSASSTQFVNNYIYKSGTSNVDVVSIENVAKINIDFNTIDNALLHANADALYTENLTTCNIRNNVLYSHKGPAYNNSGTLPTIHNYNDLFSLGPVLALQNTTSYSTLPAYAAGTSTNANSKSLDPLFTASGLPQVSQYQLSGTGLTVSGITTDIDGATRTSPPDIGAKEFTPLLHDVRFSHIKQPLDGCGYGNENVVAVLVNHGSANATGFNMHYECNGQSVNENIGAQVVVAGDSLFYQFAQTIDATEFATYDIEAWHTYAADLNHANDSTSHSFTNNAPFSTEVTNLIPVNGTTGLENQVSLSWAPVEGAVTYDLYLWPISGSKPLTPTAGGMTTINKLVTALSYGTTYRRQIHAVNICDEELPSDTNSFTTRFLPDLRVTSITIPATGFSEQTISVEWIVNNQGAGNTVPGTWFDNIYLSPDPTYNSFDPLLASVSNLNSLNAAQSYSHSKQVVLPQGANGLYYIIIKTDHYNGVKETLDNNNTTYSTTQINVTLSPPPDLIPTNITAPAITFSGEVINMTYTVSNLGDGITTDSIWKDEIKLQPAPNNSNGTTTVLSTRTHSGHLLPDSSYVVSHTGTIPANIFGDYELKVTTDLKNDVFEFASEGNNTLLSNIIQVVLTPPVDLVPDSLVTPDTFSIYGTYPVTYEVRNEGGSTPAVGWTDRYYLSPSPVYNTNFLTHLGYVYHNAGLMPGDTNEKVINLKIIGDYTGTYYLYMVTDYNNKINEYEFEENNIIRSAPFQIIKPDLVVDSLIHPASAMAAHSIALRSEVIDLGPGDYYGNLNNRYYLSNDAMLSTMTDIQLGSKTVNNSIITTTDTLSQSISVYIPADQFGSKYLLCHTDASGWAYEVNENNNVKASPIMLFESPHPDVIASVLDVPDTVTAGLAFPIQYHLANEGDVPVTQTITDSIFISFSPTWNRAVATPLAIRTTTLIDTGATITHTLNVSTSLSQNPNQYYIYIVSDAKNIIYEGSGESNNILRSDQFVVLSYPEIDLKLVAIGGIPDSINSGQALNVNYNIHNLTNAHTYYTAWSEKWYLSTDSIFNTGSDMLIEIFTYTGGVILANTSKPVTALLHVPNGITGDYYVFIETDYQDLNNDPDRNNNVNTVRVAGAAKLIHVRLSPYPDLSIENLAYPVEVVSGQYFDIITSVKNIGESIAGSRTDKIFISTNNTIENGDLALATVMKGPLNVGMQHQDTVSVFVPASYSGNYFILYSIDHGDVIYEYEREENNMLISSVIATPPPPADLIVKNILVPDSVLAGQSASITWQTENQGANPAYGQFREIIYLSPDTTWNISDEVIGIWDGNIQLSAGNTVTKTVSTAYNNVTNADYHTIIRTDAKNNVPESNEDNNDGYSYDLTNVDIEEIFLEDIKYADLPVNVNLYYKLYIEADLAERNILIDLIGDSLAGINQMYVKYGVVPTEAEHDYAYDNPLSPHQRIVIHDAIPGYYYIMINGLRVGNSLPQPISVLARALKMEVLKITPDEAGNHGKLTMDIWGSELDSLTEVKLIRSGDGTYEEIQADTFVTLDNGLRVLARFNFKGQNPGLFHVQCIRDNKWVATLHDCFTLVEGGGHEIAVRWQCTPKVFNPRFSTIIQIKIDIENIGDSDAEERVVFVGTPNYNNPVYYSLADYHNGLSHTQLVLPSEDLNGFPGILRPGGRRTYYVYGRVSGTQGFSVIYDK